MRPVSAAPAFNESATSLVSPTAIERGLLRPGAWSAQRATTRYSPSRIGPIVKPPLAPSNGPPPGPTTVPAKSAFFPGAFGFGGASGVVGFPTSAGGFVDEVAAVLELGTAGALATGGAGRGGTGARASDSPATVSAK